MTPKNINFGFLGDDFQEKLISQIISDNRFGQDIIAIIRAEYFDNLAYKNLIVYIKDYYDKYHHTIPSFNGLTEQILAEEKDAINKLQLQQYIVKIKEKISEDVLSTQNLALNFCKQQELQKAINKIGKILDNGSFESYDQCENLIRKALEIGNKGEQSIEVLDDIASVLNDDFRHPIPTGIEGIDELIGGGLGRGELALFLAAMGMGKTTWLTKCANHASNMGFNVIQIVFEDAEKIIQRKHLACWSGVNLYDLNSKKDYVLNKLQDLPKNRGKLIIKRFPSDRTNVNDIRNFIRKVTADGYKPDLVVLDYMDCVHPVTYGNGDQTANEGTVVRQLESMCAEYDFALWSALQGGRGSINADIVGLEDMGGSIKRGQVAHLVISGSKTLEQKETGTANLAILKSRFGKSGITFKNCKFDNGTMEIDTKECSVLSTMQFNDTNQQNRLNSTLSSVMNKINQSKTI